MSEARATESRMGADRGTGANSMMRMGLRLRFGVAAVLLVCTTVIASVWTLAALSKLSGLVTDTVLKVTGRQPRTFEAWVQENASAWK